LGISNSSATSPIVRNASADLFIALPFKFAEYDLSRRWQLVWMRRADNS